MTELRHATSADAEILHRFIVELAVYEREPDSVEATPESLRAQLELDTPPFEALIAEHDGEPVGFALFFYSYSTWRGRTGLYLEDLYVRPESRGEGTGRRLLAGLAKIAVERGCARMEWAVLDWNAPAIGFYRALGAAPMNGWSVFRLTGPPLDALANSH